MLRGRKFLHNAMYKENKSSTTAAIFAGLLTQMRPNLPTSRISLYSSKCCSDSGQMIGKSMRKLKGTASYFIGYCGLCVNFR